MGEAKRRGKRWVCIDDDFGIPVAEFRAIFDLTLNEQQNEYAAKRLTLHGIPDADGIWRKVTIRERSAKAWVRRKDLPGAVRAKVEAAGGLQALEAWRKTWFERSVIDFENSTITFADGTVFTDVQVRKSDIERLIRSTGPN
jgi:hypothetical protein